MNEASGDMSEMHSLKKKKKENSVPLLPPATHIMFATERETNIFDVRAFIIACNSSRKQNMF